MNFFKKFNKLDLNKKEDKKILISFSVSLLGVIMLLVGTSAAYLTFRNQGTEINTLTAANITLELPSEGTAIMLQNALPTTDTIGLKSSNIHTFTMRSTSSVETYYEIRLTNDCVINESVTVDGETITPDLCIPNEYIRVGVSLNDREYGVSGIGTDGMITSGYISDITQNLNFKIKIWLAENTPNTYQGKTAQGVDQDVVYLGKVQLYARQLIEGESEIPEITSFTHIGGGLINVEASAVNSICINNNVTDTTGCIWETYTSTIYEKELNTAGTYYAHVKNVVGNIVHSDGLEILTVVPANFSYDSGTGTYVKNFDYTGDVQDIQIQSSGYYQLEVWGAQGGNGNSTYFGGYGAYSTGFVFLNVNEKLYIYVGGQGITNSTIGGLATGGYNGGGSGYGISGSGGGATHIANGDSDLGYLSNYGGSNETYLLLVAGGGGGGVYYTEASPSGSGGSAGGVSGNNGTTGGWAYRTGQGGKQNIGGLYGICSSNTGVCGVTGSFGQGGGQFSCSNNNCGNNYQGGGGGGYYGGGSARHAGGGGGSGYIGNEKLRSSSTLQKHMTCYSCTTSPATATTTYTISTTLDALATATADRAKTGNGYARITWIGKTLP